MVGVTGRDLPPQPIGQSTRRDGASTIGKDRIKPSVSSECLVGPIIGETLVRQ